MPRWGAHGFPLDSQQRTFSHGGKCVTVLITFRSFLVCPGMVGDVVCGFRTCCMLSDTSLRTYLLVSVGSEWGFVLLFSASCKTRNELKVIH